MHELRLSFGEPQLFNLEALPFIYDQFVVIELADELYNSVKDCSSKFHSKHSTVLVLCLL